MSAVGYPGSQEEALRKLSGAKKVTDTNCLDIASLFDIIAGDFETRGSDFMVSISSVAGDRGLKE